MQLAYARIVSAVKRHPLISVSIGAVGFIAFVVLAGVYANALIYDYTTVNGVATGLSLHQSIVKTLVRYDGVHYVAIAQYGYTIKAEAAFFPLYPLAIRGFKHLTNASYDWSALLVAWLALVASAVVLYKWISFELKVRKEKLSPWLVLGLIAIFPTSFYLALPYTESLFLVCNVTALYAFRKEKYLLATVASGLATATHDQGLVLCAFFVADFILMKQRNYKKLLPIIGVLVGFLLYLLFLKMHYGSPFEFLTAERSWGRLHGNLVANLIDSFKGEYIWYVFVSIAGLYGVYKYLGLAYFIYTTLFLLMPLASGSFVSINRFILSAVPLFLGLALLGEKMPKPVKLVYISSSAFLLAWAIMLFMNGYWVA